MKVQRTIRVDRPMHQVIAYLSDFGNTVHWDPGTVSCTRTDRGPITVGSSWRNVSRFKGRTTELDYRLERLEPARLTFVGRAEKATSTDDLTFATDGVTTTVTYDAEIRFNGVLKLAGPLLHSSFEKLADEVETSLAAELQKL